MSKIPPNFNIEAVKTVHKNYDQVSRCECEFYGDSAMGAMGEGVKPDCLSFEWYSINKSLLIWT